MLLLFALIVGSSSVWAAAGDVLAKLYNTAGSGYATRQTKTDSYNVGWVLSGSSSGAWGSNSSQKANVKPTAADLPVVQGVTSNATTSTQYHYFYYTTTAVSNVGSIEFSFANDYDTNTSCNVYLVMGDVLSAANGNAYTQVELANTSTTSQGASISSAGTYTFTFATTQTSAKYYGLVIKVANNSYKRFASASLTLKEGSTGGGGDLTASDLTITNQSTALSFDLYNNYSVQVINYTTSSTGAVSIANNSYATFSIDQTNKTITVTPTAVTPSTQTITVNQQADETYAAGSATFTLSVANSAPAINADNNVNIAVDATSGVINYTISNPIANTSLTASCTDNWISNVDVDAANNQVTFNTTANTGYAPRIGTINLTYGDNLATKAVTITQAAATPSGDNFTWDLTTNSYSSSSTDLVTWTKDYATMTLAKGESSQNANSYLSNGNPSHSRLYQNQILTITPVEGYVVNAVEITCTGTSYVAGLTGNSWTNATAYTNDAVVTLVPANTTKPFYVTISGACRVSSVKVYYATNTSPYITAGNENLAYNATNGTITYTVHNSVQGGELTAEVIDGDWITLGAVGAGVPFTATVNPTNEVRTATVELTYTYNTNVSVTKEVTITQALNESGKHVPTFNINDTETIPYGASMTINSANITGGDITVTSHNTAIATVSGLVVTPQAVGTTTLTVATAENNDYAAGSKTITLNVIAPTGSTSVNPTLDFTNNIWRLPTTGTTTETSYSNGYYSVTLAGTGAHYYSSNYLMLQENGSLTLQAFDKAVTQIDVVGKTGASSKTVENIYVGETPVSESKTGSTGTNTFVIDNNHQDVGTIYTLKVSTANAQITKIIVHLASAPTVTAKLNASGYATFCSQYPLDFSSASGYTAWAIKSISTDNVITFEQITGKIKGGQGIMLRGTAGETITLTPSDSETDLGENNKLVGTLAPTVIEANQYYGLSGSKFVRLTQGTAPAGKALLPANLVTVPNSGQAPNFTFVFNDESTTAISEEVRVNNEEFTTTTWYDLNGRKLQGKPTTKGIYIMNGKKIAIK